MTYGADRSGIALMMTLFFIIAVTVILGISLSQIKSAQSQLEEERFLVQSALTLEDVTTILQNSGSFGDVNDTASLDLFLGMAGAVPLETGRFHGIFTLKSARGRINVNTLADNNSTALRDAMTRYLSDTRFQLQDPAYLVELLSDCMGGEQEVYRTDIFQEMPWLYRERITDATHLGHILDYYARERRDGAVYQVPWKELLRFGSRDDRSLNANYLTPEVWLLLEPSLAGDPVEGLTDGTVLYESAADIPLPAETVQRLETEFGLVYYAPEIDVTLTLRSPEDYHATITFEYDMKTKKARNFDYAI